MSNCDLKLFSKIDKTIFVYLDRIPVLCLKGDIYIDYNLYQALSSCDSLNQDIQQDPEGHPDYNQALYYSSDTLFCALSAYRETSPDSFKSLIRELTRYNPHQQWEEFKQWWQFNGQVWAEQLKLFMVTHRNIGHNWNFTDKQKQLLRHYRIANEQVINCLNCCDQINFTTKNMIETSLFIKTDDNIHQNI